ncbi:rRNA processing protein [Encephalitozoon intestinalis ATCC 50506]|uniref:Ribosomal protein L7Ae-like protein n=1 Tax=Encephalitozoon intestinalis (strain ATCC 50506) TaxID=876142 RepID=E0SAF6_ENCIT|nr:rRNA processing protein [Encephalitozoon intestinalis ATCC 50506]ADM12581.1 ribosomal protein L7Ae-like protein [Encephalitozoon intestinalis ATCC 50506]UTX46438.1 box C/D snornp and U4 snrnp component SNU13P [Encephalitozoon intestinalis]
MIPIASPIASESTTEMIASLVRDQAERGVLSTGIKKCQKRILEGSRGLLVLTADTTPMDLITHLPAVCEDRGIKYVFVRRKVSLPNGFTCVFLEMDGSDMLAKVLETLA